MLIYEALKKDHDELKGILQELIALKEGDDPSEIVERVKEALVPHSRAEEAVFYNSLRQFDEAKGKISHSYKEHMAAETTLGLLKIKEIGIGDWTTTAKELKAALEHHIQEEEDEIFTLAERLITEEEAEMMAVTFKKLKEEAKDDGLFRNGIKLASNLLPNRSGEVPLSH